MEIVLKLVIDGKEQKGIKVALDGYPDASEQINEPGSNLGELVGLLRLSSPQSDFNDPNKDNKSAELLYKQTLVSTMEPNRLLLYLYERSIAHLKQAIVYTSNKPSKGKEELTFAYKILDELVNTFSTSEGPLFQNLYLSHKPVRDDLSDIILKPGIPVDKIEEMAKFLTGFKDTWRKALKVDKQIGQNTSVQKAVVPINRDLRNGLNIRPKPTEDESF